MEVKLPTGASFAGPTKSSVANTSQNVGAESFTPILQASNIDVQDTAASQENFEQKDNLEEVLKQAAAMMSIGDRGLKFEMIEEAGVYQVQVIDMTDGRVVRKVPADEVLKMIAHLNEQMSDHVDVVA